MGYTKVLLVAGMPPEGGRGVAGEGKAVLLLNTYIKQFARKGLPVFFWGTCFPRGIFMPARRIMLSGDMGLRVGCSVFKAEDAAGLDLSSMLKIFGTKELYVGGAGVDRCITLCARDALRQGLKVKRLRGCRGRHLRAGGASDGA